MIVVILGAGATKGASFVKKGLAQIVPPIDDSFFSELQRIRTPLLQPLISQVLEDIANLFTPGACPSLERVFTTLEHALRIFDVTTKGDLSDRDLRKIRLRLFEAIAAAFGASLVGADGKRLECTYHSDLVKVLQPGDRILSFNYDCVIDDALAKHGSGKWDPRRGYGLAASNAMPWTPRGRSVDDGIRLYKLHGSLHFRLRNSLRDSIALRSNPYASVGKVKLAMIPPEWNKDIDQATFSRLWKKASGALRRAQTIVVAGYSFPKTDLLAETLFRVSVSPGQLTSLIIANPDSDSQNRARSIFARGLNARTRVLEFVTFADFVHYYREAGLPGEHDAANGSG